MTEARAAAKMAQGTRAALPSVQGTAQMGPAAAAAKKALVSQEGDQQAPVDQPAQGNAQQSAEQSASGKHATSSVAASSSRIFTDVLCVKDKTTRFSTAKQSIQIAQSFVKSVKAAAFTSLLYSKCKEQRCTALS